MLYLQWCGECYTYSGVVSVILTVVWCVIYLQWCGECYTYSGVVSVILTVVW